MDKLDLSKKFKTLYAAKPAPALVDVPPLSVLAIDGAGAPDGSQAFADAVGALYAISYGLKFGFKMSGRADWKVMPLEGLWWADDMSAFPEGRKA